MAGADDFLFNSQESISVGSAFKELSFRKYIQEDFSLYHFKPDLDDETLNFSLMLNRMRLWEPWEEVSMFCMWEGCEPLGAEVRLSEPVSKDRTGRADQQVISEMMECGF